MLNRGSKSILLCLLTYQESWFQTDPSSNGKKTPWIGLLLLHRSRTVRSLPAEKSWYGRAFFRLPESRCDRATGDARLRVLTFRPPLRRKVAGFSRKIAGISLPNGLVCGRLNSTHFWVVLDPRSRTELSTFNPII